MATTKQKAVHHEDVRKLVLVIEAPAEYLKGVLGEMSHALDTSGQAGVSLLVTAASGEFDGDSANIDLFSMARGITAGEFVNVKMTLFRGGDG